MTRTAAEYGLPIGVDPRVADALRMDLANGTRPARQPVPIRRNARLAPVCYEGRASARYGRLHHLLYRHREEKRRDMRTREDR
jgi:hypothetical protein